MLQSRSKRNIQQTELDSIEISGSLNLDFKGFFRDPNAKKLFDIKRNALKCLTVIFRDFINYSRECINMILRPAWKLMNMHLPIFTEVLGYNQDIKQLKSLIDTRAEFGGQDPAEEGQENEDAEDEESLRRDLELRGFESDEDDEIEEPHGIRGMTLQLIELLTTLVQRPNV